MSRLDCIYASPSHLNSLSRWDHTHTMIPTDHKMVKVLFALPQLPHIGKGHWTWPLGLLHDKNLTANITTLGLKLQEDITSLPPNCTPSNIQTLWEAFKTDIMTTAKSTTKVQLARINCKITALKREISLENNSDRIDTTDDSCTHSAKLEKELEHLEKKRYKNAYVRTQACWHIQGEKINNYWCKLNSPKMLRDIIYKLVDPITNRTVSWISDMAEIARNYHTTLLTKDLAPMSSPERQQTMHNSLSAIPLCQKLNDPDSPLHALITTEQTLAALYTCKNGTAAGMDGIPYEVWNHLHKRFKMSLKKKGNPPCFDIIMCLTKVFNDIQLHGVEPTSNFALRWMCPIYKKKDRAKIENYHPITLLNTDYKSMTKALAMQLAHKIHTLIHPDQTRFIPQCSIFDPIHLAKNMCDYADHMEEDGTIVAPDQEKAYDKIDHMYLLSTL